MIDLEQERRDFKKTWMILGGHFKYLVVGENQAYHLANNAPNLTPLEKELTLSAVNTAWAMWLIQARDKQAEIDALKAQLEQLDKVWISVDFMLPNEGEKVLIMIGDEQTVAEKCNVFGFIDVIDREALRTDLITYWMPLPKPPVKEAEGG